MPRRALSPESPDRTARTWPSSSSTRGTRSSASCATRTRSTTTWSGSRTRSGLIRADLLDQSSLLSALDESQPDEVYNLAAPSFVPRSWEQPVLTAQFAAVGATSILEAIRETTPEIRFYQASSSEIFGEPRESPPERADTARAGDAVRSGEGLRALHRRDPTAAATACSRRSGILYNHESPRRPLDFVTRKVAHARGADRARARRRARARKPGRAARLGVCAGLRASDVAHAPAGRARDYVVATGVLHSVRDLVERAFGHAGLEWERHVRIDEALAARKGRATRPCRRCFARARAPRRSPTSISTSSCGFWSSPHWRL